MTEVRIVSAPRHGMERHVGRFGVIIGVSGQFIKVRFEGEGENMYHFFTPDELSQR